MPRSVNLPPFRSLCTDHDEPVLLLDREPLRTRLSFTNNMKEDHPMSKEEFVIHCIRHSEDYPETGEIDLDTARSVLDNLVHDNSLPSMTADEFCSMWNSFVHDPLVMDPDAGVANLPIFVATKRISVDNGHSFVAPAEAIRSVSWDTIVNMMDDAVREKVASELAPCSDEAFLIRYLELAPSDLIVG